MAWLGMDVKGGEAVHLTLDIQTQPGAWLTIYSVVTCVHRNESAGGVRP